MGSAKPKQGQRAGGGGSSSLSAASSSSSSSSSSSAPVAHLVLPPGILQAAKATILSDKRQFGIDATL